MDNCIFCKIVKGDIPSYKIYEDESYLAFLDISQFVPGHTLVIPKVHHRYVWDINDPKYLEVINKVANHFRKIGYEFVDSVTFGRLVPHAHLHLIPHNNGEESKDWKDALEKVGQMQSDQSRRPTKEQGDELVKKFKLPE